MGERDGQFGVTVTAPSFAGADEGAVGRRWRRGVGLRGTTLLMGPLLLEWVTARSGDSR